MDWGVILVIIIFQPEIRRALEQLGGNNRFSRFFGFDKLSLIFFQINQYRSPAGEVSSRQIQKRGRHGETLNKVISPLKEDLITTTYTLYI